MRLTGIDALLAVGQALSVDLPTEEAMRRVAREVARALGADMVGAYFLDVSKEALVPVAGYRVPKELLSTLLGTPFPLDRFPVLREAWRTREPAWTLDYRGDPRFDQTFLTEFRPQALLFAPTPVRSEMVGGLFLAWWEARLAFTPDELRLIRGIASQVGLALENGELARRTKAKLAETETLLELARDLASTSDPETRLRHLLRQVTRTLGADTATAWLAELPSGTLVPIASYPASPDAFRGARLDPRESALYADALDGMRAVASSRVPEDPRIPASLKTVAPHQSQLFVPVTGGDRAIGAVLALWWDRTRELSEHEITLCQAMVGQAGAAIENARLIEENRRRERELAEQRRLLETTLEHTSQGISVIDQERAEDARDSEERFRSAFEHSGIGMALQSLDGRYLRVNRALCDMIEYSEAELLATTWQALALPDDVEPGQRARLTNGEIRAYQVEKRYLHRDGHPVWTLASTSLVRDRGGQPLYFIAQVQDISERKRSEEAREALEAQLRQAQKMEAVGRLAGGVAHDFNNLLTVIRGRSDLLLYRLGPDDALRRHVLLLQQTAERAAALTQQLLAFSRKQMLQPRILDLNGVVESTTTMLRRLIGEDIELDIRLDPDLGRVKADPGQLEQVILNLAVNARDAMPQGGRLSIETANVELDEAFTRRNPGARPGGFARLQVGDTGVGMDATVQAHLFEPFFTTKALGQGTGLGLATVYGIVKQSGGYIKVDSTPGRGTTFAIYLPRVEEPGELRESTASWAGSMAGSETILLVEDEDAVRELGREVLEMYGYTVLEAPHGAQALLVAERHTGPIRLMVTDVVMPHMSGRELVERLVPRRPDMRILYVSGYTDDAIVREGMLQPGIAFLQKPFTPEMLARRVRELLDAP